MFVLLCENASILADGVLYGVFYAEINFTLLKFKYIVIKVTAGDFNL